LHIFRVQHNPLMTPLRIHDLKVDLLCCLKLILTAEPAHRKHPEGGSRRWFSSQANRAGSMLLSSSSAHCSNLRSYFLKRPAHLLIKSR
jgi:hypothetical protein